MWNGFAQEETYSEQKIDGIAKGLEELKHLIQQNRPIQDREIGCPTTFPSGDQSSSTHHQLQPPNVRIHREPVRWEHSSFTVDFIRNVVRDSSTTDLDSSGQQVLSSLQSLLSSLEHPAVARPPPQSARDKDGKYGQIPPLPPLDVAVNVLKWAQDNRAYYRCDFISRICPLEHITNICKDIYFTTNPNKDDILLTLVNGYLGYLLFEHHFTSGSNDSKQHGESCRAYFETSIAKIPLVLPTSMEVVSVLTLAAFNSVENSKGSQAWTYVSSASSMAQTMGFHRRPSVPPANESEQEKQAIQGRLFWTIYRIEKGSLHRKLGIIQSRVYDDLYSPAALAQPHAERGGIAGLLAKELRGMLGEIHQEMLDCVESLARDNGMDVMRIIYLQLDLVCQSSLLTLILKATPAPSARGPEGASDECIAAARDVMDFHQQCMTTVKSCKSDPTLVRKYLNWAIVHVPFVPFDILFHSTVRSGHDEDVTRLENFAASLQPESASENSSAHPHRMYDILCQAVRLHLKKTNSGNDQGGRSKSEWPKKMSDGQLDNDLSHWYYGNQQLMEWLDGDFVLPGDSYI